MNHPTVWPIFCQTFNNIYDRMVEFDSWYDVAGNGDDQRSHLAGEWANFIRASLDNIALSGRINLDMAFQSRAIDQPAGTIRSKYFEGKWKANIKLNRALMNLALPCANLPPTTIPLATGGYQGNPNNPP